MKGITHFAAGVAVASCFPEAVAAGAASNPLYFILGGCFGLLPDTLDFKLVKFLHRHDIEIAPDPLRPDPRMIAEGLALGVRRAAAGGRPVRVKLDTVRLGADAWQRYSVTFDAARRRIAVAYGPAVDTGQKPLPGATVDGPAAEAPVDCDLRIDYLATQAVDIFDGPEFELLPEGRDAVRVGFLPWHRRWSHSLPMGLLLGLLPGVVWGPLAAAVSVLACWAHVALDQAGFMGSNLFYPFTRRRTPGLQLAHSTQAAVNAGVAWGCCLLVYANLAHAAGGFGGGDAIRLASWGLAAPLLAWRLGRRLLARRLTRGSPITDNR